MIEPCTSIGNFFNSPLYFQLNVLPLQFVASLPLSDWNSPFGLGVSRALGLPPLLNFEISQPWQNYLLDYLNVAPLNPCFQVLGFSGAYPLLAGYSLSYDQFLARYGISPTALASSLGNPTTCAQLLPLSPQNPIPTDATNTYTPETLWQMFNPSPYNFPVSPDIPNFDRINIQELQETGDVLSYVSPLGDTTPLYGEIPAATLEYQSCVVVAFDTTDCSYRQIVDNAQDRTPIVGSTNSLYQYFSAYVGPINQSPNMDFQTNAWAFGHEIPSLTLWSSNPTEQSGIQGLEQILGVQIPGTSQDAAQRSMNPPQNIRSFGIVGGVGSYQFLTGGLYGTFVDMSVGTSTPWNTASNCRITVRGYSRSNDVINEFDVTVTAPAGAYQETTVNIGLAGDTPPPLVRTTSAGQYCITMPGISVAATSLTYPYTNAGGTTINAPNPLPGAPIMPPNGDASYSDALALNYTFQFDVLNPWRSAEVRFGVNPQGSEGFGVSVPTAMTEGRSYTNGWLSEPYTCQGADIRIAREILPGHPLKTYDGYSHPDSVQSNWLYTVSPKLDGTLATCALPPAEQCEVPWNVLMEWDSLENPGDSAFPDIQNVPADEIWLLDGSTANGNCYQIYQGEVLSSPVCPDGCAQGQSCPDLCIEWVGATPVTIPGCVSRDPHALTRLTYRPLILEFGSGVNLSFPSGVVGIVPGDGLAPLWKFASVGATSASVLAVQAMYKIFAWNAAGLTLATENTEWTYADCGALQKWGTNPNNGAVLPGLLIQYPCNMPLNYICVWDFTKYGAIEGHACQPCGDSSRITGAPRVNTTCFAEYPDAIPANNPAGFAARAAVQGGTVTDFISQPIAFDAVRSYWIKSNATVLMNLPNARNTLVRGYSSLPGATTRGVSPDYATGYNLDLAQIWSVDCGEEISYATLETARYLALSSAYCSPDSPQKPGAQIPQSALPTALQGIPPQTSDATARYLVQCSQAVVEPASYVVMDETGFPTPYFADSFQPIPSQSVLGLALTPIVSSFSLYNTGKNPAFLVLQPGVSTALSGVLSYRRPREARLSS